MGNGGRCPRFKPFVTVINTKRVEVVERTRLKLTSDVYRLGNRKEKKNVF